MSFPIAVKWRLPSNTWKKFCRNRDGGPDGNQVEQELAAHPCCGEGQLHAGLHQGEHSTQLEAISGCKEVITLHYSPLIRLHLQKSVGLTQSEALRYEESICKLKKFNKWPQRWLKAWMGRVRTLGLYILKKRPNSHALPSEKAIARLQKVLLA